MPGGIGAYTDSRGAPGIRKEIADYLTQRDGFPSDPEVSARPNAHWATAVWTRHHQPESSQHYCLSHLASLLLLLSLSIVALRGTL